MRKAVLSYTTLSILFFLSGCKTPVQDQDSKNQITVVFLSKSGSSVKGTAVFKQSKGVVSLQANLSGLTPGVHAIHIHEKSDCSSADASSAGGHWNPTFEKHGKWGSASFHRGDIGNFTADAGGNGMISFSTDLWCIDCDDPKKNILDKALIVHQGADDYTTQPTGDAGGRVACTAIIR